MGRQSGIKDSARPGGTREDGTLRDVVRRIRAGGEPEKIVLFGSRGRGAAKPGSDYDILVVRKSRLPRWRRSGPIYSALPDVQAEVEVVVFTPEEVEQWRNVPQALVTTALREGKVLYERQG